MRSLINYFRQAYISGFQTFLLTGQQLLRHAKRLSWQNCRKENTHACGMRTIIIFRILYLPSHYICESKIYFKSSYKYSFICHDISITSKFVTVRRHTF
jgi:hypothetical protein